MNELFTWRRLGLLVRNDFIGGYRGYLNIGAVVLIVMALNAIPSAGFTEVKENLYYTYFSAMIFWWGTVQASLSLHELLDKKKNEGFLLLPASALEKTVARYLFSSVLFVLHILVFTTVAAFILEGINTLLFGRHNSLFNPFDPVVWNVIGVFMAIQPVFFLGGAWFKRARWFKTIITLFVIGAVLGLILLLTFLVIFAGSLHDIYLLSPGNFDDLNVEMHTFKGAALAMKLLFYGVVPPFCFFVSWLRVKETQVSHGI